MILDVAADLAELLEPDDDQVHRVVLDLEPLTWEPDHLYVYPTRDDQTPFETGPSVRQDFELRVVYVARSADTAQGERDPELAIELDRKRHEYAETIRHNQCTTTWDYIRAGMATAPRTLEARGSALRITGYRIVS